MEATPRQTVAELERPRTAKDFQNEEAAEMDAAGVDRAVICRDQGRESNEGR